MSSHCSWRALAALSPHAADIVPLSDGDGRAVAAMVDLVLVTGEMGEAMGGSEVVSFADGTVPTVCIQACFPDGTHWVGGRVVGTGEQATGRVGRLREHPVVLTPSEVAGFLVGFARSTLEPLSDDRPGRMQVRRGWWETYSSINQRFATVTAASSPPNATVTVHGLELLLAPAALRRQRPDLRIILRLAVPFPSPDRMALLPWRRELIEGMLGADVIVVPSAEDASHVSRAIGVADARCDGGVHVSGDGARTVIVESAVQIDASGWSSRPFPLDDDGSRLLRDAGRTLFLGVDRSDHTSGVLQRVRAFGELLEEGSLDPRDAKLVELVLPSRSRAADDGVRRSVLDHVARINEAHGEVDRPIEWHDGPFTTDEIVRWYRRADVLVVTSLTRRASPLALEYVACRPDGTVVLSEFSSTRLPGAVLAHPFDLEDVKRALLLASTMTGDERQASSVQMRQAVAGQDHRAWLDAGVAALARDDEKELLTDA